MSSPAQVTANQRNAMKSTGPISNEGKVTASQNARKHGLFSKYVLTKDESPSEFKAFREKMMQDMAPASAVEELLADRVIALAWKLRRVTQIESGILSGTPVRSAFYEPFVSSSTTLGLLTRYEISIERSFYKSLHELQRVQAHRLGLNVTLPVVVELHGDGS